MSSVLKSIKLLVACIDVALVFNHQGYWMYSWEGVRTFKAEGTGQMGGCSWQAGGPQSREERVGESWRATATLAKHRAPGTSTEEHGQGMGKDACFVASG